MTKKTKLDDYVSQSNTQDIEDIEEIEEVTEEELDQVFQGNHYKITAAYFKIIDKEMRFPSNNEIAELTGLHYNTISTHLKHLRDTTLQERFQNLAVMSDKVMLNVLKTAMGDGKQSIAAAKFYFEIIHKYVPTAQINVNIGRYQEMTDEDLDKENAAMDAILNGSAGRITDKK